MSDVRVWVGCLACYNGGTLRGEWVDAADAADVTTEALHGGPTTHEELWCLDLDDRFGILGGQELSPSEATAIMEAASALEDDELAPFVAYLENVGYSYAHGGRAQIVADSIDDFRDSYAGEFSSEADYAAQLAEDIDAVSGEGWPMSCIDWDRAWGELRADGYWSASSAGGYHIFRA